MSAHYVYFVKRFELHSQTSLHAQPALEDFLNKWAAEGLRLVNILPASYGYNIVFEGKK